MENWKKKFDEGTLRRGRDYSDKKRVDALREKDGIWTGAVLGRERYEVTVRGYGSDAIRMNCKCPVARSGRCCEHMAAVLYAIDAEQKKAKKNADAEEARSYEAELMAQWLKYDEELRRAEKQSGSAAGQAKRTEGTGAAVANGRAKATAGQTDVAQDGGKATGPEASATDGSAETMKPKRKRRTKLEMEAARREAEQKELEMQRRAEEKVRAKKEAEEAEQERRLQSERAQKKRQEREQRKAEQSRRAAEQKQAAEAERIARLQKQKAEEERREEIRRQKAQEAERRAAKRAAEQKEAQRLAKLREEEERRKAEEEALARAEWEAWQQREADKKMAAEKRESEYELLGTAWEEDPDAEDTADAGTELAELERYTYFDGTRILGSVKVSKEVKREAERLIVNRDVALQEIAPGINRRDGEPGGQALAAGKKGKAEFTVGIGFSRTQVLGIDCGCPKCSRFYSSWYPQKTDCAYAAATLILLSDYLNTHNVGDATDGDGQRLLALCEHRHTKKVVSGVEGKAESLTLLPRLIRKDGQLKLSFKVGEKKLFVIKNLTEFCRNVRNSATDTYGSSTQINHNPDNFTEKGRQWIRFISQIVREEEAFLQRLAEARDYYWKTKSSVGSELNLFGWRLDEFYKQLGDGEVDFEDRDGTSKKKATLTAADRNPKMTLRIEAEKIEKDVTFHGIHVRGNLPELYRGTDVSYYIDETHFCRVEERFLEQVEPFSQIAEEGSFDFQVGRNRLAEFYHRVLPGIREIAEVTEKDGEKIHAHLLPEVRFVFYLDAEPGNAYCEVSARYGDRECTALDVMREDEEEPPEPFRDVAREAEVLYLAGRWFPEIDWEKERMHCGGEEEQIYRLMESGVQSLMELGEVRCTKRFIGYQSVKSVRVSVGVSVASGLLDLEITTDDVPQAELLEILAGYRAKKTYYRLKDGSFVNLSDPSLEMLTELMDAAHVKTKELLKGKLQLPVYRTLYLDKLLEEHESVYSSRDAHFRKIVKGFKTVKDADYEEPESLKNVMRNYQKDGYKWLRTIESWQFGGILADDMGLGKTLQVIAVLLAAKEEGQQGTSLVVAPASLVYNWGEEFARFAPELRISLITGQQEERQKKIEQYQDADVLVTSYDLLKRDIACYEGQKFLYEIIDEAQYIKNHTTAAAKAVKVIGSRTRFALTGTPIENRLSELWSIFDYLMPGFLYSYEVFRKEMETPIVKSGDEAAMNRLQKMVGPFILRRLKGDVLRDLPEKLEEERYVKFEDMQQKLYDGQVVHMRESLAGQDDAAFQKNRMQILAELTRLRQICCDPSLCFEDYNSGSAKLEACVELIRSAADGGHRMLVFSQFTSMLEILQQRLKEEQIAFYVITGATSKEQRLTLVKEFNEGDVPVFLISLKAGGVGLNLTGADMVIHYDPWWNVAVQNQATDRAHRIGQTKRVTVYKLIAKGTIEEKIQKLQETKRDLAEQVIGGDASRAGALSREELLELLDA